MPLDVPPLPPNENSPKTSPVPPPPPPASPVPHAPPVAPEVPTAQSPTAVNPAFIRPIKEKKQLSAKTKRKIKIWFIAVLVLLLLTGAGIVAYKILSGGKFGPQKQVEAYLDAVVAGDAKTATDLYVPNVKNNQRVLLTNEIYQDLEVRPTAYRLEETEISYGKATVTAQIEFDGKEYETEFELKQDGKKYLIFNEWRVTSAPEQYVNIHVLQEEVTINGKQVTVTALSHVNELATDYQSEEDLEQALEPYRYPVLPGRYEFSAPTSTKYVTNGDDVTVDAVPGGGDLAPWVAFSPHYSEAVITDAKAQVLASIESCTTPTELIIAGCEIASWHSPRYDAMTNIQRKWTRVPKVLIIPADEYTSYWDQGKYGIEELTPDTELVAVISDARLEITYDARNEGDSDWITGRSHKVTPFVADPDGWTSDPMEFPITIDGDTLTVDTSAINQTRPEWLPNQ